MEDFLEIQNRMISESIKANRSKKFKPNGVVRSNLTMLNAPTINFEDVSEDSKSQSRVKSVAPVRAQSGLLLHALQLPAQVFRID